MLVELRIENFAVIEHLTLRLEPGLNVLSGETGAGKSIIVGALSLLLGERASSDVVRAGASRAVVEGVFEVEKNDDIHALLDEHGVAADDGLLILRREIVPEGRSRAWINGAASTATLVGEVGRRLVDLHGQHEHQTLLHAEPQRAILDAFGGATELAASVATAWADVRAVRQDLDTLDTRRREMEARVDLLRHQAEEIERAAPRVDEEEALESETRRLEHAEELTRLADRLHRTLYADEDAIAPRLDELRRTLSALIRLDPSCSDWEPTFDEAFHDVQELGRQMGDYAARVEHNPSRLDELRRRQDLLFRLKTKFGPDIEDVIATGKRARAELDVLDGIGFERTSLEKKLDTAVALYTERVRMLSDSRATAAKRLDREVARALHGLGMSGARFVIALDPLDSEGGTGAESIEFRVSVNPGFEPGPLARIASGGELSRIMLALKSILAREDHIPSLVFDEIDAGIGGRVANQVADRLRAVAAEHQVFVVTHLPQIASRADHHLVVEKRIRKDSTTTSVTEVEGEARVRELARMLGGDPDSAVSLQHARELLATA